MAVKLTHLKNIASNEVLNTYQLILDSLFGGNLPEGYDENKTYIKGDAIIKQQEDGSYQLMIVKTDEGSTTGPFKAEDWALVYFTDLFREGSALDIDFSKATQIAYERPKDKDNITWYLPVNIKDFDGSNINIGGNADHGITIYENEHFAAQDNEPDNPNVRLWLDYDDENK